MKPGPGRRELRQVRVRDIVGQVMPLFQAGARTRPGLPMGVHVDECQIWLQHLPGPGPEWRWHAERDALVIRKGVGGSLAQALTRAFRYVCVTRREGAMP